MTLALANLNLDFSFVKIEAPTEYRQLGVVLAKSKRSAAEVGEAHALLAVWAPYSSPPRRIHRT